MHTRCPFIRANGSSLSVDGMQVPITDAEHLSASKLAGALAAGTAAAKLSPFSHMDAPRREARRTHDDDDVMLPADPLLRDVYAFGSLLQELLAAQAARKRCASPQTALVENFTLTHRFDTHVPAVSP